MNTHEQIKVGLQYLAANDTDHATDRNGRGFNARDTQFGNDLAEREILTENQQRAALKMLQTYRGQLEQAGLELPSADAEIVADAPKSNGAHGNIRAVDSKTIAIRFAYDSKLVDLVKAIAGRRFDGNSKQWYAPLTSLAQARMTFPDFELDAELIELAERSASEARALQAEQDAGKQELLAGLDLDAVLPNGQTLYAHQKSAVVRMLEQGRLILADDMGLGKTKTALICAKQYQAVLGYHIFVVAPVSLRENWLREAAAVGVSSEVFSWSKIPAPLTDAKYVLIADEAHYAQNLKSKRTQSILELADKAQAVFLLTGTPIKNGRPVNLFPLLKATRHALAQNKTQYEKHFCAARATRFTQWDVTGAAHLDELHSKTQDIILRRLKKECLDLPEKTRVLRHVEMSADAQKLYAQAYQELRDSYNARLASGEIMDGAEAIVMLNYLRHAGSVAKTETAIEMAQEIVEQGGQVVLFTEFLESAEILHRALGGELLTGETENEKRQAMVDRFQSGDSRVFVGTIKAGGVGITLTAAANVILVDRPWTPGDAVQAEDRLHRIGQTNAVTAHWLQANGTDETIDALLQAKQERIELVLHGKRKTLRGLGSAGDIAKQVLETIVT